MQQLSARPRLSPAARTLSGVAARRGAAVPAAPRAQRPAAPRAQLRAVAVLELGEAQWEAEVLKADVPVLVDFWAKWCGPCRLVAPTMDWAEKEYRGALKVVKVEADPNQGLINEYKVYGLPTFVVFKQGEEVMRIEGAVSKAVLVENLKKVGVEVPAPAPAQ